MSLGRFCFILLLFFSNLKASYLRDLNIEILLKNQKEAYQNISSKILKKEKFKNYSIKLILDNEEFLHKQYYIKFRCNKEELINSNIKYNIEKDGIIFKINKNSPNEIYFEFKSKKEKTLDINIVVISQFEYEVLSKHVETIMGISYGIIFCAFLYSFIIYLNTKIKSVLFYSYLQISILSILIFRNYMNTHLAYSYIENVLDFALKDITIIAIILFSKEVLSFNKYKKYIRAIFDILIFLNLMDILLIFIFEDTVLYEIISIPLLIAVLISFSIISYFQGFKESIYFILGWVLILLCLLIEQYQLVDINDNLILAIGLPLESLILSSYLGYKLKLMIKEKREKEKLFIQQNKLASMGEMLNNIAHQWRQPLANLSFINMDLQLAIQNNDLNKKYLYQIIEDSTKQIDFMSNTLDDFKGFYQPNKKRQKFLLSNTVKKAINIINPSLESIKLSFEIKKDKELNSYENEYIQVILNILTNAKDALLESKKSHPQIKIELSQTEDKKSSLKISDNAYGIEKKIINKIFEPYFSTKNKNSGIGLYMSKIIVQSHLKGEISLESSKEGTSFYIVI
ncbi:histidine kinase [Arcobacter sp. CECT 8983]|uniref:sensor histidine kinase n=1 Tax=Arcobacter sp. CECT 8983 TaxID=2044508 RepID=UPI00100A2F51|nr:HAMP domain-containing sensor histidine kinase [Arcobacter sp. CECT 8983]RXJ88473.1 histidine kinase [Arcobacter sp. CECT 8983]